MSNIAISLKKILTFAITLSLQWVLDVQAAPYSYSLDDCSIRISSGLPLVFRPASHSSSTTSKSLLCAKDFYVGRGKGVSLNKFQWARLAVFRGDISQVASNGESFIPWSQIREDDEAFFDQSGKIRWSWYTEETKPILKAPWSQDVKPILLVFAYPAVPIQAPIILKDNRTIIVQRYGVPGCKWVSELKTWGMCDSQAGMISNGKRTLYIDLLGSEADISVEALLKNAVFMK